MATDEWPWDEEEWRARFDFVNEWVCCDLETTHPELATALFEFLSRVEAELDPYQIFDVALRLRDLLEGTSLIAAEGLSPWSVTQSRSGV